MRAPRNGNAPAGTEANPEHTAEQLHADSTASDCFMCEAPDFAEARRYLTLLDESAEHFAFRVFDDDAARSEQSKASHQHGKDPRARTYNGPFDGLAGILAKANADRCGVFVVANAGGQKKDAIDRVRAVFADTDGAALDPILSCGLEPHVVVESSPGKWHVYWLVDGLPLDQFKGVQLTIAQRFGTDASVHDLPRVMRLPGFDHHKGAPHRVRVIRESSGLPYSAETILAEFPPAIAAQVATQSAAPADGSGIVVDVGRHDDSLRLTARMARAVVDGGMSEASAWAAIEAEADRGRWTRAMPELRREFDDALRKIRSGEFPTRTRNGTTAHGEAANDAPPNNVRRLFTLTRADRIERKATDWLIRGYLVRDTLAALIAKPGACKSFLAVDWACRIATGTDWYGREVKPGAVFYFAGEGQRGLRKRIDGWEKHNGVSTDGAPLYIASAMPFLCDPDNVNSTLAILRETAQELHTMEGATPTLIVVDTVARAMNGANENATDDMGKFIKACDDLRDEWKCTVLAVHHTGNDPGAQDRGRGNSNFGASMDSDFYLKSKGDDLELKAGEKAKDWRRPPTLLLSKVEVEVSSIGDDGEPVTETTLALHDVAGSIVDTSKQDRVLELHNGGLTIRAIAEQTGVSRSTVQRWLKHAA